LNQDYTIIADINDMAIEEYGHR